MGKITFGLSSLTVVYYSMGLTEQQDKKGP